MTNVVNGHDKTGPGLKGCAPKAIDIANAEHQFREAASQRGLKLPLKLAADGKIHRCGTEDEPRGSDGSYILHLDGVPAGGFQNWKDGVPWQNWRADIGRELTGAERDALAGRAEKGRRQQEAEGARRHKEAAKQAAGIWNRAKPPAPADHPYLLKKGVGAHGLTLHASNGALAGIANGGDADCTVTVDVLEPEPAPLAASRFTIQAPELLRLGYSPIPRLVRNGEGRPAIRGWSDYCSRQPTQSEIGEWSKIAGADIALCMGFNGAIAIDVDTNEPEILDAVRSALPYCCVARFGSKGFALLGRHADGPQRSFAIYSSGKARKGPLIEIMGTGRNITIPPSIHAKTGRAYQWIDPENGGVSPDGLPRLSELTIITGEDLERLREAVAPWAAKPREPKPRPAVPGVKPSGKRLQAYAQKGLENIGAGLASATAGRNNGLFSAACSIGWAVHHRVLSERAVTDALLSACRRNGALADHGRNACIATIDSGLSKSAGDDLPVLEERAQANGARYGHGPNGSAFSAKSDTGAGAGREKKAVPQAELAYRNASGIKIEPVTWMWPDRIPHKRLSILTGPPCHGKSQITIHIAAVVSTGGIWPDGTNCGASGSIIFLSAEDTAEDTIVPRLKAAGADLGRVFILDAVRIEKDEDGQPRERCFDLTQDIERLEKLAKEVNARLIIIDPISAYLGDTESHSNSAVRGLLAPLSALAARSGVTVLAITHDRKGGGKAMERTIGSVAFTAAPRAVWGVAPEMDEEGEPTGRNIMTRIKGNLAPDIGGLAYEIEGIKLDSEDYPEGIMTSRIKWHEGAILLTADQVYDPASGGEDAGEKSALEDAIDWLRDVLTGSPDGSIPGGPKDANWLVKNARQNGVSERTLRRASVKLRVVKQPAGFGKAKLWSLPDVSMLAKDSHLSQVGQGLAERANLGELGQHGAQSEPSEPVKHFEFEGEI